MPHTKFIVAGGLILGAITYLLFSGISDSMVYYYTVSEALELAEERSGNGIRVSGYVSSGTIERDESASSVGFLVYEKDGDQTLPVVYQGIIPDTFGDDAEVVVEGTYRSEEGVFHANVLLAKCPSKYEAMGDEHPDDIPLAEGTD
ncbi:MAG: cytochrome c maturation protein CcmE [Acidobacteriota bacterium]